MKLSGQESKKSQLLSNTARAYLPHVVATNEQIKI